MNGKLLQKAAMIAAVIALALFGPMRSASAQDVRVTLDGERHS